MFVLFTFQLFTVGVVLLPGLAAGRGSDPDPIPSMYSDFWLRGAVQTSLQQNSNSIHFLIQVICHDHSLEQEDHLATHRLQQDEQVLPPLCFGAAMHRGAPAEGWLLQASEAAFYFSINDFTHRTAV